MHYYAHLERFGEFERGDLVMAGDIVGYVGNTGNARGTPPHLHYGVYAPGVGAINPFPLLQQD
jgi:murein DD-endopeptidase MepM/ murein hydrolase activator NlpD